MVEQKKQALIEQKKKEAEQKAALLKAQDDANLLKKKKQEAEQLQVEYNEATGAANVQAEEKPVSTKSIDEMEAEEKKKADEAKKE